MPAEVQMQAIAYMNAMQEPHPGDPAVDSAFVMGAGIVILLYIAVKYSGLAGSIASC